MRPSPPAVPKTRYPPDWPEIARAVKEAAGWRCLLCGHPHDPATGYTLTVHHRDGAPSNCDPENLRALCQRCHLLAQAWLRRYGSPLGRPMLPGFASPLA